MAGEDEETGKEEESSAEAGSISATNAILITVAVAAGAAALLVIAFWMYHIFLISKGFTTKEHLKGSRLPGLGEELTIFVPRALACKTYENGQTWMLILMHYL